MFNKVELYSEIVAIVVYSGVCCTSLVAAAKDKAYSKILCVDSVQNFVVGSRWCPVSGADHESTKPDQIHH